MRLLTSLQSRRRFEPAVVHCLGEGWRDIEQQLICEADRLLQEASPRRLHRFGLRSLAMAHGARDGSREVAPFVLSLRQCDYRGGIALLTYGRNGEVADSGLPAGAKRNPG